MSTRIFARKSGNKEVSYRWAGEVGSGRLVPAQKHPAATTTADDIDTWSDAVDGRVTRRTPVRLPAGTLILASDYEGTSSPRHIGYTAAIVSEDPKNPLDWAAARHVGLRTEDIVPGNKRAGQVVIHRIEVGGVVAEYRCD